jgi:hypothetical protein
VAAHPLTWTARALWILLPFTIGDALITALETRPTAFRMALTWSTFGLWTLGALALFVLAPLSLTAMRLLGPLALVTGAWAAWQAPASVASIIGLVVGTLVGVLTCGGELADDCVDASSYGDERRFSLRAPGAVVLFGGPLAWVICVAGLGTGPLLLANRSWLAGAVATVVGVPAALLAFRSLHALSTRFLVFVPAGITLVDPLTLVDPVLFARREIQAIGPAPATGDRADLTANARGLALQINLSSPTDLQVRRGPGRAERIEASAVALTPARVAAVLTEAQHRRLPVG